MKVDFERDGINDEVFIINWPDSQICFHLIRRGDKLSGVKEAVYILMDKFRTKFYIGETGEVQGRFRTHKWQKDFWHCAVVIEDRNGAFKKQDVRKWFEWRLYQIASERSREDKKYEILSRAGRQEDRSFLENRINDILAVCRFLGIPWGYASAVNEKSRPVKKNTPDKAISLHEKTERKRPAPNFSFEMAGVPTGAELIFTEGGQIVRACGKNQVNFNGTTYSLTGFTKAFMPPNKRNRKDSYQGPAFFTYKGILLTTLRKKQEAECQSRVVRPKSSKDTCLSGQTKTQLAKMIAMSVDGREGAFGGILQYFSRFKPCPPSGKWRHPLSAVGIKFDEGNRVIDWRVANIPQKSC